MCLAPPLLTYCEDLENSNPVNFATVGKDYCKALSRCWGMGRKVPG